MVKEGQGGQEGLQMIGNNSTTDLDDGKLLGGDRSEVRKVLLDFALGPNVTQQLHDGGPSRRQLGISGTRVVTALQQRRCRGLQGMTRRRRAESGRRNGVRCGKSPEGLAGGSPHGGAKRQHLG